MTIWKYKLELTDEQDVEMPVNAQILCVQEQHGKIMLWAVVDETVEALKLKHRIVIYGTGKPVDPKRDMTYIGTVQIDNVGEGTLVWHIFEAEKQRIFPKGAR